MKIRRDFNLGIASIILINIFSAFTIIGLFSRLSSHHIDYSSQREILSKQIQNIDHEIIKNIEMQKMASNNEQLDLLSQMIDQLKQQQVGLDLNSSSFLGKQSQIIQASQWVLVVFSLISLFFGILIWRSLNSRLMEPIEEIFSVLKSIKDGDHLRRCTLKNQTSELRQVYESINEVLDKKSRENRDRSILP